MLAAQVGVKLLHAFLWSNEATLNMQEILWTQRRWRRRRNRRYGPISTKALVDWIKVHEDKVKLSFVICHGHLLLCLPSAFLWSPNTWDAGFSLHGLFILNMKQEEEMCHKLEWNRPSSSTALDSLANQTHCPFTCIILANILHFLYWGNPPGMLFCWHSCRVLA